MRDMLRGSVINLEEVDCWNRSKNNGQSKFKQVQVERVEIFGWRSAEMLEKRIS